MRSLGDGSGWSERDRAPSFKLVASAFAANGRNRPLPCCPDPLVCSAARTVLARTSRSAFAIRRDPTLESCLCFGIAIKVHRVQSSAPRPEIARRLKTWPVSKVVGGRAIKSSRDELGAGVLRDCYPAPQHSHGRHRRNGAGQELSSPSCVPRRRKVSVPDARGYLTHLRSRRSEVGWMVRTGLSLNCQCRTSSRGKGCMKALDTS